MIFVTVGTHTQGFERLIKKMDEIAGKIDEEVVMQIGYTNYVPKNAKWFRFLEYEKMLKVIEKSRIIVCHGGAGTLLDSLKFNKLIVVVPRLRKYNEAYDDHELELADALSREGRVIAVYDIEDLERILNEVKNMKPPAVKRDKKLTEFLKEYIRGLEQ